MSAPTLESAHRGSHDENAERPEAQLSLGAGFDVARKPVARMDATEARHCCVSLPILPLQILWRRRPEWRGAPVAVVSDDSPEAPIELLSRAALARGLRLGLRLGVARNMDLELRVGQVTREEVSTFSEEIAHALGTFSPRVERCDQRQDPFATLGCFFVDPKGLDGIYGGVARWAEAVYRYLCGRRLSASVVTGLHAHRCLAVARTVRGIRNLGSDERASAEAVTLRALGLDEAICQPLHLLGVATVGDLLRIPEAELQTRFGPDAAEAHRLFSDGPQLPLQARREKLPPRAHIDIEAPTANLDRLTFVLKRAIDIVVAQAQREHRTLARMELGMRCDEALARYRSTRFLSGSRQRKPDRGADPETRITLSLEPASPTVDARQWLELWRLRLASLELPSPVLEMTLDGTWVKNTAHQLDAPALTGDGPARGVFQAQQGLARVAAAFGPQSLLKFDPRDAHLPEARARLRRLDPSRALLDATRRKRSGAPRENYREVVLRDARERVERAASARESSPRESRLKNEVEGDTTQRDSSSSMGEQLSTEGGTPSIALIRRLQKPRAISVAHDGLPRVGKVPTVCIEGPYRISGGWWGKSPTDPPIQREYFYAHLADGRVWWVYRDQVRRRWYAQARVS